MFLLCGSLRKLLQLHCEPLLPLMQISVISYSFSLLVTQAKGLLFIAVICSHQNTTDKSKNWTPETMMPLGTQKKDEYIWKAKDLVRLWDGKWDSNYMLWKPKVTWTRLARQEQTAVLREGEEAVWNRRGQGEEELGDTVVPPFLTSLTAQKTHRKQLGLIHSPEKRTEDGPEAGRGSWRTRCHTE